MRMMSEGSEFNSTIRGSGRYELGGDVLEERDEDRNKDEAEAEEEEEEEEEDNEEGDMAQSRVNAEGDIDGSLFDSDEAFAQALQEKEYRDTTARLMALAGIHDRESCFLSWCMVPHSIASYGYSHCPHQCGCS